MSISVVQMISGDLGYKNNRITMRRKIIDNSMRWQED